MAVWHTTPLSTVESIGEQSIEGSNSRSQSVRHMQLIASSAISGSREGRVRSEIGISVARTVPGYWQMRISCGGIGDSRYALPSLHSGACVEAETRTTVSGSTNGTTESKRSRST